MSDVRPTSRTRVIEQLSEAFAQDRIGIVELERRLEEAARARSEADLRKLLDGIPPAESREVAVPLGVGAHPEGTGTGGAVSGLGRADPAGVRESQIVFAFWGGRAKEGAWTPPRRMTAIGFQGGVELDFREALWGAPVTAIRAFAVMGGIHIVVPPGVRVETSGFAIMGGFADDTGAGAQEGAPVLRISGMAVMGGVEVSVRLPGESEREARERGRRERRIARGEER